MDDQVGEKSRNAGDEGLGHSQLGGSRPRHDHSVGGLTISKNVEQIKSDKYYDDYHNRKYERPT